MVSPKTMKSAKLAFLKEPLSSKEWRNRMSDDIGVFEAMYQLRAMRRFKPDPVPDGLIWKILEAGTKAPSGSNSQVWRFIVVRDLDGKRFIQERYKRAWDRYAQANLEAAAAKNPPPAKELGSRLRMARTAAGLAERMHETPVLLLVCMVPRADLPTVEGRQRNPAGLYASIFPAVQNMLLAVRALGLGAVLTTLHLLYEDEIKERFGIPSEVDTVALLPIGYPKGKFGPTRRRPVHEVTYWEKWGATRSR
ncbi:MAG: nitroreductase family protein [Candidatus Binatia bacterium]